MSGVLFQGGIYGPKVMQCRLPSRVRSTLLLRKNQIALIELLAVCVSLLVFSRDLQDSNVVLFIDNQTAEGFLRNGFAKGNAKDATGIVSWVWHGLLALRVN